MENMNMFYEESNKDFEFEFKKELIKDNSNFFDDFNFMLKNDRQNIKYVNRGGHYYSLIIVISSDSKLISVLPLPLFAKALGYKETSKKDFILDRNLSTMFDWISEDDYNEIRQLSKLEDNKKFYESHIKEFRKLGINPSESFKCVIVKKKEFGETIMFPRNILYG